VGSVSRRARRVNSNLTSHSRESCVSAGGNCHFLRLLLPAGEVRARPGVPGSRLRHCPRIDDHEHRDPDMAVDRRKRAARNDGHLLMDSRAECPPAVVPADPTEERRARGAGLSAQAARWPKERRPGGAGRGFSGLCEAAAGAPACCEAGGTMLAADCCESGGLLLRRKPAQPAINRDESRCDDRRERALPGQLLAGLLGRRFSNDSLRNWNRG